LGFAPQPPDLDPTDQIDPIELTELTELTDLTNPTEAPNPPETVAAPSVGVEAGGAFAGPGERGGISARPHDRMFYGIDLLEGVITSGFAGPPGPRGDRFVVLTDEETAALARLLGGYALPAGAVEGQGEFVVGRRTGTALLRLAVRLFEMQLECRLRSAKFLEEMILA
jgi:hypothetical protein